MSVRLVSEIWNLVNESIPHDERAQIAEELVGILMEHEYELDDIRYEFTDMHIQDAVKLYADENETEYDDYSEDDEQEDQDW